MARKRKQVFSSITFGERWASNETEKLENTLLSRLRGAATGLGLSLSHSHSISPFWRYYFFYRYVCLSLTTLSLSYFSFSRCVFHHTSTQSVLLVPLVNCYNLSCFSSFVFINLRRIILSLHSLRYPFLFFYPSSLFISSSYLDYLYTSFCSYVYHMLSIFTSLVSSS